MDTISASVTLAFTKVLLPELYYGGPSSNAWNSPDAIENHLPAG